MTFKRKQELLHLYSQWVSQHPLNEAFKSTLSKVSDSSPEVEHIQVLLYFKCYLFIELYYALQQRTGDMSLDWDNKPFVAWVF